MASAMGFSALKIMKIDNVKFNFQNDDAVVIQGRHIGFFSFKIQEAMAKLIPAEISHIKYCKKLLMEINAAADIIYDSDVFNTVFDRFEGYDLMSIDLTVIDEKTRKKEVEHYYVNWFGSSELVNNGMDVYINEEGHLYLAVSKAVAKGKKSVFDYFPYIDADWGKDFGFFDDFVDKKKEKIKETKKSNEFFRDFVTDLYDDEESDDDFFDIEDEEDEENKEKDNSMKFSISDPDDLKKLSDFVSKHNISCRKKFPDVSGAMYEYSFLPTALGTLCTVKCPCGKELTLDGDM